MDKGYGLRKGNRLFEAKSQKCGRHNVSAFIPYLNSTEEHIKPSSETLLGL